MARRPTSFVVDTDILIDYLNGIQRMREILDVPRYRVYYSSVTKKELLAKRGLSAAERQKIYTLLQHHRLIPVDKKIAERFSRLLTKYAEQDLRKADALLPSPRSEMLEYTLTVTQALVPVSPLADETAKSAAELPAS